MVAYHVFYSTYQVPHLMGCPFEVAARTTTSSGQERNFSRRLKLARKNTKANTKIGY
jgi:hypothetical protein